MNHIEQLLDMLYSRFLLRDVFGMITPGFLVMVSFIAISRGERPLWTIKVLISEWSTGAFLIAIAVAWVLGFAAQEALRLWGHGKVETETNNIVRVAKSWKHAPKQLRMARERYVVIKEATGHASVALAIFAFATLISLVFKEVGPWLIWPGSFYDGVFLAGIAIAVGVLWSKHKKMSEIQSAIDESIMSYHEKT